ncbi:acetyl-CoA C-acetyltransferase [Paenarthrobacter nitroguajacolicus]|uniref:thiolase family protein n=1 Tax=Paenarthrobacter nitroguajacolicus TaxID=211146 RepID=UPI00285E21DB|nr:thiolase family protein [Paenarthrobacter nitroguajacolicus]MDR6987311.1 acetyl-CoA C-acetyltransferase [Paenarthrobacter nitroguajacolicus]
MTPGPSHLASADSRPWGVDDSRQPVIVGAFRSPICRANGRLKHLRAHDLLAPVLRSLLDALAVDPGDVDDVIVGNAVGGGGNVARYAALQAGLPVSVPGLTVDRQCGSGLDAIALASKLVAAGGDPLYLAGGVESISTAPARATRNDDGGLDFYTRATFVPEQFGDPDMGVAAENVARHAGVTREQQDEYALRSHRRAAEAAREGRFDAEVVPVDSNGTMVVSDDGPRGSLRESTMARFPAAFVPGGTVTAGNSCFDADAASAVVITSLKRARAMGATDGLLVLGCDTAGVDPQLLGIGAARAAQRLLTQHDVPAGRVDLIEFNEAFASQTIACLDHLGISPERANLDGGALALGHGYGASGAVLVTRLLAQSRSRHSERGVSPLALAMISIAGGMGTAALLEYSRL